MSLVLRPCLLYPHMRFPSVDWLKEALLTFRQVRRIFPGGPFDESFLDADQEVQRLHSVDVPGLGPMILNESVDEAWPEQAQHRLFEWLQSKPSVLLRQFEVSQTIAEYGTANAFHMNQGKFANEMLSWLTARDLAWEADEPLAAADMLNYPPVYAVHPRLGEAIMSVMAIAIAERKQLNIVTTHARVHRALLTRREADVFQSLATKEEWPEGELPASPDISTDAAQLVIQKYLDLSWVSLADVAAIVRDGNDFQRFRVRLQQLASEVGLSAVPDRVEQAKQVAALADAARKEWETYRKGLGSFGKMFVATAVDEKAEAAIASVAPAALGYATLGLASVGVGLAVGALTVTWKTVRGFAKRRESDPYRYLSQLTKHGATLITDNASNAAPPSATVG